MKASYAEIITIEPGKRGASPVFAGCESPSMTCWTTWLPAMKRANIFMARLFLKIR